MPSLTACRLEAAFMRRKAKEQTQIGRNRNPGSRPRARQIGCAGQFAIPEVIEDAWEVLYFARNYFGSMTLSPFI